MENAKEWLTRFEIGARQAEKTIMARPGRFVPREACTDAVHIARLHGLQASFFGGYEDAERVQVCFHPLDDEPIFTGVWMEIRWNSKFDSVTHPDLLGSLMALSGDRSAFGDLIAGESSAYLYCLPELSWHLPDEWTSAGRHRIQVALTEGTPQLPLPSGQEIRVTTSSLRLDSVLSAGAQVSRAKAQDAIRSGDVFLNHIPEERVDRELKENDLISVRGHGRIRLMSIMGTTKHDRLSLLLERFLH